MDSSRKSGVAACLARCRLRLAAGEGRCIGTRSCFSRVIRAARAPKLEAQVTQRADLDALDLGALLCSRVCHDIISPVGAIINGLDVLDEDNSEEMREFAFSLIRRS